MRGVAFAGLKGSPGVTTLALAVARRLADRGADVTFVEADPSGGSAGPRLGAPASPSLASWSSDARRGFDEAVLVDNMLDLGGSLVGLLAPVDASVAGAALARRGSVLAEGLGATGGCRRPSSVVDVGRLDAMSAAMPLASAADVVLLVVRPDPADTASSIQVGRRLADLGLDVSLVLVGREPHSPAEIAANHPLPVVGVIEWDPRAASAFWRDGVSVPGRRRRSLWWRSVAALADGLADPEFDPALPPTPEAVEGGAAAQDERRSRR